MRTINIRLCLSFLRCYAGKNRYLVGHDLRRPGELSQVLNTVAANNGSILTINQGIPLQGVADVSLSIETKDMTVPVDELIKTLEKLSGVSKVDIIGQA